MRVNYSVNIPTPPQHKKLLYQLYIILCMYNFSRCGKYCKVGVQTLVIKRSGVMAQHNVYSAIVRAVKSKRLREPFGSKEFRATCPGFAEGTYNVFLNKHRKGNPGGNSELFIRVAPGRFRVIRPFKYGL